jgi:predicted aldo/keto reductase-like oxidoreductase
LANYCIELVNGKLFTCCYAAHISDFNKYFNQNLEITNKDYIDIYEANSIDEILRFLSQPIPFCRYCNWEKMEKSITWGMSKKEIIEWT